MLGWAWRKSTAYTVLIFHYEIGRKDTIIMESRVYCCWFAFIFFSSFSINFVFCYVFKAQTLRLILHFHASLTMVFRSFVIEDCLLFIFWLCMNRSFNIFTISNFTEHLWHIWWGCWYLLSLITSWWNSEIIWFLLSTKLLRKT